VGSISAPFYSFRELWFVLGYIANIDRHENGGFGAAPGHDPHMLYTVSAVQILCLVDGVDELDRRREGGKELVGKCGYTFYLSVLLFAL
jgi:hypothetical protein